ncbi:MAG: O-antigen ligase family protein [Prevotella sp.]|nr:O-antigen ligase family protein [Prevotella sp.]
MLLLFLLFLLALYQLATAGLPAFAIVCLSPVLLLIVLASFHYRMFVFWVLLCVNFFIQWKDMPLYGIPMSLPNEMLEIVLLALAIIDVKESRFERLGNVMLLALVCWCLFCTLEVLNDTCDLGLQVAAWYAGARMMAFQLLYAFLVYTLYITNPKLLTRYLFVWGALSLFAVFWVWKQKYIGLSSLDSSFLQGRGRTTHLLQGGSLIRYWSTYSDAANFGIGIASTAVAFLIFGITARVKTHKYFFLFTGLACLWAMFPSGTRTATVCFFAGIAFYIFLSKSFKIAVPVTIFFIAAISILAFTTIGNSNQQIRRMRSAFNKNDASTNQRTINQAVMKKYLADAPFGLGIGMDYENVPANNKYRKLATIPPDSEYVFIWIHTGRVGITLFLITTFIMLFGACWIVFFKIKSPSLRGIGAGLCCAFVAIQLGGYGNQVLMQFPNCLLFYGGLTLVYILPRIENEWNEYESGLLAKEAEKKKLKNKK